MIYLRTMLVVLVGVVLFAAVSSGETRVSLGLSGPGAVNDSTIKVGQPVSVDVYWLNQDDDRRGFVTSFRIFSDNIKTIKHWPDSGKAYNLADSGKGVSEAGDVRAHSGWEGTNVWDFTGLRLITVDWNGNLPDTIGFGGVVVKNRYGPHERKKVLSWAMIVKAAVTGNPVAGFLSMVFFGFGTVPVLFFTGFSASIFSFRIRLAGERVAAISILVMGIILLLKGATHLA